MSYSTAIRSNEHQFELSQSPFNQQSAFSATLNVLEHGLAGAFKALHNPESENLKQTFASDTGHNMHPACPLTPKSEVAPMPLKKAEGGVLEAGRFVPEQTVFHTIVGKMQAPTSTWLSLNQLSTRSVPLKQSSLVQENGEHLEQMGVPVDQNQTPYRTYKKNTGNRGIVLSQKSQTASPWNDPVIVASIQAAARHTSLDEMIIAGQYFKLSKV